MNFFRFYSLLVEGKNAWGALEEKKFNLKYLMLTYALPFIILGTASKNVLYVFENGYSHYVWAVFISNIMVTALGVLIAIYLINRLAPRYKALGNIDITASVIIYSLTPLFVISLFAHFIFRPEVVTIFGLFLCMFPFASGLIKLMKMPSEMMVGFIIISLILFLGINYFLMFFLSNFLAIIKF